MKLSAWWHIGYVGPWGIKSWRPYSRVCDELCNDVRQFTIPWLAVIELRLKPKRSFSDGLWYTSGGRSNADGTAILYVNTYGADGKLVTANIPASRREFDQDFGDDAVADHPKIYTDSEVLARASSYEIYSEGADDFVQLLRSEVIAVLDRPGRWA